MKKLSVLLLATYLAFSAFTSYAAMDRDESPRKKNRFETSPLFVINRFGPTLTLTFPTLDSLEIKTSIDEISAVSVHLRAMFNSEMSEASARQIEIENNDPDFGSHDLSLVVALIFSNALSNAEATQFLSSKVLAYDQMGRAGLLVHALRQANFFMVDQAAVEHLFFSEFNINRTQIPAPALSDLSGLAGRLYILLCAGAAEGDLTGFLNENMPLVIPYLQEDPQRVITHALLWQELFAYTVVADLDVFAEQLLALFDHPSLPEKMPIWKDQYQICLNRAASNGQVGMIKNFLNHALKNGPVSEEWLRSLLDHAALSDQKEVIAQMLADQRIRQMVISPYLYGSMFRCSFKNQRTATSNFLIVYASCNGFKIPPDSIGAAIKDAAENGKTQTFGFLLDFAGDETINTYFLFEAMGAATRHNDCTMVRRLLDYFAYHQLFKKYMKTRTHGFGGLVRGPAYQTHLLFWQQPEIVTALDKSVLCATLQERPENSNDVHLQGLATAELVRRGIDLRSCKKPANRGFFL